MLQVIRLFLTDQSTTDLELEDGRIDRFGAVTFEDVDNLLDDGLPNRHLPTKKYYFLPLTVPCLSTACHSIGASQIVYQWECYSRAVTSQSPNLS